ncbi:Uncharacterized conserved protein YybS, DUF2232 family [Dethiosulfatibacter aminovorans DSM 17477]|uniref:Uncharacterized conserved protein YybS, DUF2232 family n=1 Tax=Dethiosulfatibacter aminovorans DSM 17477 TaxID=1121476 RepID=A0A1M6E767_9FIRM|nr:YybS family protein [Dethiosulfatibacter aminovorans]SHI81301.1 Uncharacterized conserved protein YybS, DUF2232 family [Dethiosulfatibacter aminovorans DSM 17477]
MNRNLKTKRLTDAALATSILTIFAMIGSFLIPYIDFIYPLPAILLAKRQDWKISTMALVAASIIIFVLTGMVQTSLYYFVLYTPMASVMCYFISKDERPWKSIVFGGVAYLLSFVVMIMLMQAFMGINFVDQIRETFVESLNIQESLLSHFEGMEEQLEATRSMYDAMLNAFVVLMPGIIIISALSMSAVNYMAAYKMGRRLRVKLVPIGRFSRFRLPNNIAIGILVFAAGSYLISQTNIVNSDTLMANLVFMFQIMFFIQGLAVVRFMMDRYKIKKFLRVVIIIGIIFNSYLMMATTFMGMFDQIFDFRKLKNTNRW